VVEAAAVNGVKIEVLPFIAVEPLLPKTGELPEGPATVIFTSANAVTALEKGRREWNIFCLSGATQRQAAEHFGKENIVGMADSASELASVVIRRMSADQVDIKVHVRREAWFFCGDKRRGELPDLLAQAGITVREVIVYRTKLTPQRIGRAYDAVAFFSPSAVESFFSVNTLPSGIPLFAIGGTTAAAIRGRCDNVVMVSERPDEEALLQQIIKNTRH